MLAKMAGGVIGSGYAVGENEEFVGEMVAMVGKGVSDRSFGRLDC